MSIGPFHHDNDLCAGEPCSETLYCHGLLECIAPEDDDGDALCTWPLWLTHTIIGIALLSLFALGGIIHFIVERIRIRLRFNQHK